MVDEWTPPPLPREMAAAYGRKLFFARKIFGKSMLLPNCRASGTQTKEEYRMKNPRGSNY